MMIRSFLDHCFMSKSARIDHRYYFGPSDLIQRKILLKKRKSVDQWDFTVREESHPNRIFVSTVQWGSDSYAKGLRPNDQILSINGIPSDQFNSFHQLLQVFTFIPIFFFFFF